LRLSSSTDAQTDHIVENKNHNSVKREKLSSSAGSTPFSFVANESNKYANERTPFNSAIGTNSLQFCCLNCIIGFRYLFVNDVNGS